MLIVWYLCSVSNLVQISVIVTEIDQICFRPSFDDVTRINFRFRLLIMWSSPYNRYVSSHLVQTAQSNPELLTFFPKFKTAAAAILDFQVVTLAHSGVLIVWCLSSVPNLAQISVIVTEIVVRLFPTFT